MTPWTAACQASVSFTISQSLLKLGSIESVIPSNHLILCRPLLLLPAVFPSIRIFTKSKDSWMLLKYCTSHQRQPYSLFFHLPDLPTCLLVRLFICLSIHHLPPHPHVHPVVVQGLQSARTDLSVGLQQRKQTSLGLAAFWLTV